MHLHHDNPKTYNALRVIKLLMFKRFSLMTSVRLLDIVCMKLYHSGLISINVLKSVYVINFLGLRGQNHCTLLLRNQMFRPPLDTAVQVFGLI